MDRYAVFVDMGYFSTVTQRFNIRVDYEKMTDCPDIQGSGQRFERLRTYIYECPIYISPNPTPEEKILQENQDKFFHAIRNKNRFEIRLGRLQKIGTEFNQKMVDTLLSIDLVMHSVKGHIQKAIIIAGDSDFIPAINIAKENGVVVNLLCFKNCPNATVHDDLKSNCDEVIEKDKSFLEQFRI